MFSFHMFGYSGLTEVTIIANWLQLLNIFRYAWAQFIGKIFSFDEQVDKKDIKISIQY